MERACLVSHLNYSFARGRWAYLRLPAPHVWSGTTQIQWETLMATFPEKYLDLANQKAAYASLATLMDDGTPQVTPVWFDYTDGKIRVNTATGRVKAKNMVEGAPVALAILDPDNPYRYVQVRGKVTHTTLDAPTRISKACPTNILASPTPSAAPARNAFWSRFPSKRRRPAGEPAGAEAAKRQ